MNEANSSYKINPVKILAMRELVLRFRVQMAVLNHLICLERISNSTPGVETLAPIDLEHIISNRYAYMVHKVLYHCDRLCDALSDADIVIISTGSLNDLDIPLPKATADAISFEFDALISACGALLEAPVKENFKKFSSKCMIKNIELLWPKRSELDGLFWRTNILRNRTVHPDNAFKTNSNGRPLEFNSNLLAVEIKNGEIVRLPVHLMDLKNNSSIQSTLSTMLAKDDLAKKQFAEEKKDKLHNNCQVNRTDIFSAIFQTGVGANHLVLMDTICLLETAIDYVEDYMEFLSKLHKIIAENYFSKDPSRKDFWLNFNDSDLYNVSYSKSGPDTNLNFNSCVKFESIFQ